MSKDPLADHRLYCTFSVRYKINGRTHILMPGQAFPVYDAVKMGRQGPEFDIVLVTMSMDRDEEFVPQPGYPGLVRERYRTALKNIACNNAETQEHTLAQQGKLYSLGGASGISVLRPHRLPLGVGLYQSPVSASDPRLQHEEQPITLAQAEPIVSKLCNRQSEMFLPLPRFYIESEAGQGNVEAKAVTCEHENLRLTESTIPVCACPVTDIDMLDLQAKVIAHFDRTQAKRVWLGLDLLPVDDAGNNYTLQDPVTVEDVLDGKAPSPVMYTLPHGSATDYYAPLRFESKAKLNALFRGKDRLETEFIPYSRAMTQIVTVAPAELDVCLAEAGLPTA